MSMSGSCSSVELFFPFAETFLHSTVQHFLRSEVTDCTVKPFGVVVIDVASDLPSSIVQVNEACATQALPGDCAVIPFDLPIALRITDRRTDVLKSHEAQIVGKVPSDKLFAVVRDEPRLHSGVFFQSSLDSELDVVFLHGRAQLMVENHPGEAVEDADQEQERTEKVDILDVRMPVLVYAQGLLKTIPFC